MSTDTVAHRPPTIEAEADVCLWARRRMEEFAAGVPERRTEAELVEALAEEEIRLGRAMSRDEIRGFALGFFAPSYAVLPSVEELARAVPVGQGLPIKDD